MRVLSLFDGMACGHIAFTGLGYDIESYKAYEIDKYAIQVATHNFPDIEELGDVFEADFTQYQDYDWLIGGSPCTYWSIAQTKNRETVASGMGWELFSQYVRALHETKPKYFLYENNKSMSKDIRASITEAFGFEPICINSALVSAQNRQRLYWVGVRLPNGTYRQANIEQPEDMGILLKDVLDGIALSDASHAIISSVGRTTHREYFQKNQNELTAELVNITDDGKSQTLKAQYYKNSVANFCGYDSTYGATGVGEPVMNDIFQVGSMPRPDGELSTSAGFRIYSVDAKGRYLCANGGGAGAKTGLYAIPVEWEDGIPTKAISYADGKTYTVYEAKDGQITIKDKTYPIKLVDGYYIIRKLTVAECKRLQTVPEWYDMTCISNSQAYKCLGNGWTVEVIKHLIKSAMGDD